MPSHDWRRLLDMKRPTEGSPRADVLKHHADEEEKYRGKIITNAPCIACIYAIRQCVEAYEITLAKKQVGDMGHFEKNEPYSSSPAPKYSQQRDWRMQKVVDYSNAVGVFPSFAHYSFRLLDISTITGILLAF